MPLATQGYKLTESGKSLYRSYLHNNRAIGLDYVNGTDEDKRKIKDRFVSEIESVAPHLKKVVVESPNSRPFTKLELGTIRKGMLRNFLRDNPDRASAYVNGDEEAKDSVIGEFDAHLIKTSRGLFEVEIEPEIKEMVEFPTLTPGFEEGVQVEIVAHERRTRPILPPSRELLAERIIEGGINPEDVDFKYLPDFIRFAKMVAPKEVSDKWNNFGAERLAELGISKAGTKALSAIEGVLFPAESLVPRHDDGFA